MRCKSILKLGKIVSHYRLVFVILNIAVCLLLYMTLRKWRKHIHRNDNNEKYMQIYNFNNTPIQKTEALNPQIPKDFLNRTMQLEDSIDIYFDSVGSITCYGDGTIRRQNKSCICRNGYSGNDCGIPTAVAATPIYSSMKAKLRRRQIPRRVVMAFTFNHEFDQLEARLYEHYKHVDVFLIVESNYSSHGDPKPLRLWEKIKNGYLTKYIPKIMYVFLDKFPPSGRIDGWAAEEHLYNAACILGLPRLNQTKPDDLFLFSDADELVSKEVVTFLKLYEGYPEPIALSLRWSVFTFYWKNVANTVVTSGCSLNMLKRLLDSKCYNIRGAVKELSASKNIKNVFRYRHLYGDVNHWVLGSPAYPAGWHCSWCFSPEGIRVKLTSAINADFPRWGDYPEKRNIAYISKLVKTGTWFDGKKIPYKKTKVDKYLAPAFFLKYFDKFKDLLQYDTQDKNVAPVRVLG